MSKNTTYLVGGVAIAVVLAIIGVPWWVIGLVVVGVPVAGYLMLDPSQRRRLKNQLGKNREIGR